MSKQKKIERILFAPLGNTDPIRDMRDGATLHIMRHYKPDMVVLFYTKEILEKEEANHRYTKAFKHHFPDIEYREIKTDIINAHLYESFFKNISAEVDKLHKEFKNTEILLNLSSGTPQMKTAMAMLAVELRYFADGKNLIKAVQVSSPNNSGNDSPHEKVNEEDVDALIDNNLDDYEDAKNRCIEPELSPIRYFGDKQKIISLINQYDYKAALNVARTNPDIPKDTVKLLEHADFRLRLMPRNAANVISKYKGDNLITFEGNKNELWDYLLTMQINQWRGELSLLLLKSNPFLQELLEEYIKSNLTIDFNRIIETKDKGEDNERKVFIAELIKKEYPSLYSPLNKERREGLREKIDFSPKFLMSICEYAAVANLVKYKNIHKDVTKYFGKFKKILGLRNSVAHKIMNIDENQFYKKMEMTSKDFLDELFTLTSVVYGEDVKPYRDLYTKINAWIIESLE